MMPGDAAGSGDGLPAVDRMFNLYHPFDPVGFRLEPLISVGAEKRRPVYAAYCKGGRRLHVGLAVSISIVMLHLALFTMHRNARISKLASLRVV